MIYKIFYIIIAVFLISCQTTEDLIEISEENIDTPKNQIIVEESTEVEIEKKPQLSKDKLDDIYIQKMINNLSIEEKIGQLFIFEIRGHLFIDAGIEDFINTYKPGGIIFFANNIKNDQQVKDLINGLQKVSKIPLFIGVDEEGGLVSRLGKNKNISVTHLPPALTVGNKGDTKLAYYSGRVLGKQLRDLGFNMDMAPVADVNTNPNNPVIGNRTYSADPHIAGDMVSNVIKGLHEENIIAVIKHFPGHGDTSTDSHLGTVVSPHKRERLDQIEFIPFIKGIDARVDSIMTAHMVMPGISSAPLPATLNPEIISGILREDFGFEGLIMTDALDMGAISQNYTSAQAAILAIKAGVDILLIPDNQPKAFSGLLENVNNHDISVDRINESLTRILKVKLNRNIILTENSILNTEDKDNDSIYNQFISEILK